MIITVTLNAAIDKTLAVPNFRLGRRHRAVEQTAMAGGKGVNVARALRALGQPVIATGIAGGPTGTRIVEHLTEEGILNDFVRIREESRTSTAVVDPTSGDQTEINEHGPHVSEAELDLFVDKLLYLAKGAAVCVFAGSLPRGVDAGPLRPPDRGDAPARRDHRARLRGRAAAGGHAQGPRRGDARTSSRPRGWSGASSPTRTTAGARSRRWSRWARARAIMTLADGCMAVLGDGADRRLYRATLEPLEPVSSVGSGDAFLAGFVAARYGGRDAEACLRFARGLRGRVDPALRRRAGRAARGRAAAARGAPGEPRRRPQFPRKARSRPLLRSGVRPPSNLGSANGSRDRAGQEGPPRIRLR